MIKLKKKILFLFIVTLLLISCNSNSIRTGSSLNEQQLNNLVSFAELYGVVQYFNPSSEGRDINWDKFALMSTKEVLKANSDKELKSIMEDLFLPIAPALQVYFTQDKKPFDIKGITPENPEGYKTVYWQHIGFVDKGESSRSVYRSYVVNMDSLYLDLGNEKTSSTIKIGDYAENKIQGNIGFNIPIALYYKENQTYPKSSEDKLNSLKRKLGIDYNEVFSTDNAAHRIADIIICWNVFQHFYPYFDDIDSIYTGKTTKEKYWTGRLKTALSDAYESKNKDEFENVLKRLVADLNDGHGNMSNQNVNVCYPPFLTEWIENQLVITKIFDTSITTIKPGDIITKINDKNALQVISETEKFVSASTFEHRRLKCLKSELFKGEPLSKFNITVSGKGQQIEFSRTVGITKYYSSVSQGHDTEEFKKLTGEIYYVNLTNIAEQDLMEKLDILKSAKAIIFDMRGYPKENITFILQHIAKDTILSGKFMVPFITKPNFTDVKYVTKGGRWILPPLTPKINAKVIFLTNANAVSYSESFMGIAEYYKLGEIFGEHTAGMNGNVAFFYLPGDYSVTWTGMKVLKHDNSKLFGVGVLPTNEVKKTIEGVKKKQDEVLQKAIDRLSTNL